MFAFSIFSRDSFRRSWKDYHKVWVHRWTYGSLWDWWQECFRKKLILPVSLTFSSREALPTWGFVVSPNPRMQRFKRWFGWWIRCGAYVGKDEMMGLFWKSHKVICALMTHQVLPVESSALWHNLYITCMYRNIITPSLLDILGHPCQDGSGSIAFDEFRRYFVEPPPCLHFQHWLGCMGSMGLDG